jgi:AGCS family alanine or glycine:cation symporter
MINFLTSLIFTIENSLWSYVGIPILLTLALYLSFHSNFFQIRKLPVITRTFISLFKVHAPTEGGIHPLKAFFACVGGAVGIGNVVGVCTAVQLGGPGALLWIWLTAMAGMIVKYAEVYLGMRYRVPDGNGGHRGGPMYFLQKAFSRAWVPTLVCILLWIYGVEIFQFSVVTKSISANFNWNFYAVVAGFLGLILLAGSGGIRRVGTISSALIPIFVITYVGMGFWVLAQNLGALPAVFANVIASAFTGHAAMGAFAGSTILLAASHGVRRGCYSGDIGIGYASIIHSESSTQRAEKQASLVIFEIFMDTFLICTTSVLLVLVTGTWHEPLEGTMLVQQALAHYFPYMNFFMPFFLFLVGYATINAYFCVGLKCAEFLLPRTGRIVYYAYAVVVLVAFSFLDSVVAQSVMAIAGGSLLVVNCFGIFRLRHDLSYHLEDPSKEAQEIPVYN